MILSVDIAGRLLGIRYNDWKFHKNGDLNRYPEDNKLSDVKFLIGVGSFFVTHNVVYGCFIHGMTISGASHHCSSKTCIHNRKSS